MNDSMYASVYVLLYTYVFVPWGRKWLENITYKLKKAEYSLVFKKVTHLMPMFQSIAMLSSFMQQLFY